MNLFGWSQKGNFCVPSLASPALVTSKSFSPVVVSNQRSLDNFTDGTWRKQRVFPYGGFGNVRFLPDQVDRMRQNDEFLHVFYRDSRDFKMFFASWESLENPVAPPFTLASSKMHSTSVKEQLSPLACQTVGTNRTDSSNNGVVKLWNSSFLQRNWYQQYVMFRLLQT